MPAPQGKTPAKLTVDFTGVEVGGQRGAHVPEGDYLSKVTGVTHQHKKDDETKFNLNWKLEIVEPTKFAGKVIYYRTALGKESLWSLRSFLVDMLGEDKVPKKVVDLPLALIVKKQPKVGITLVDDDYNPDRLKSKVVGTFSKSDWESLSPDAEEAEDEEAEDEEEEEEEEEEEAPTPKKKAKTPKAAVTESDDDEDMEEIDMDDL